MNPSQVTNPSHITIFIDGQELDDFSEGAILDEVVVRQELNDHWWCEVVCRQTEDQRFPFEDALGKPLKASTFDTSGAEHVAFTGFVLESQLDYEVYGSYTIHLVGVTKSYKLDLTPRQAYYHGKTMSDVTNKLVGDAGLSVEGVLDSKQPLSYVQYGETDFDFIKRMVDDAESWMRPTEDGIDVENQF
ncbi:MAG: contractile injection system protein, VgrG/Pvc8 family, partial [Bryobacteraceae bacterium]